jgi:hypothetical protein
MEKMNIREFKSKYISLSVLVPQQLGQPSKELMKQGNCFSILFLGML